MPSPRDSQSPSSKGGPKGSPSAPRPSAPRPPTKGELPARPYRWQYGQRLAPLWRQAPDNSFFRPFVSLLLEPARGLTVARELHSQPKSPEDVRQFLLKSMAHPAEGVGGPCRPAQLSIDDPRLLSGLSHDFRTMSIKVALEPDPGYLAAVLNQLEATERGFRVAPLITRVHLDLARELYRAALRFRRSPVIAAAEPRTPLAIQLRDVHGREERVAAVLGPLPCGLALFGSALEFANWLVDIPRCWIQFTDGNHLACSDVDFLEAEGLRPDSFHDYPWVGHANSPDCANAEPRDLKLLAFCLQQLPDLLDQLSLDEDRLVSGTGLFEDQVWTMRILATSEPSVEALPAVAAPPADPPSLEQLVADFLATVDAPSTHKKHSKNLEALKRLWSDAGRHPLAFDGDAPFQEAYAASVSASPKAWTGYVSSWRALQRHRADS